MKQQHQLPIQSFFTVRGLLILMVITGLAAGCYTYKRIYKTISVKKALVYRINTTGSTDLSTDFTVGDLISDLTGKTYESPTIGKFDLTSILIKIDKNSDNTADSFRILSVGVTQKNTGGFGPITTLISEKNISIADGTETVANAYLLGPGVSKINEIIGQALVGKDPRKYVYPGPSVQFQLKGSNVPTNSRVSATLTITLDCTIQYAYCEPELALLYDGGSDRECK